ncbi:hypothetical protein EVJ58_g4197 [Rhodofomes roseus]|uniref:NUDE domain-containing protein n=1 Tax=Rhodofomes roseus TaxID=34475 RepID=A0A4Y9YJP7_9APHY|nr:hypothetical protein EVJ58_g4197 [Rhodofomes roseus]
MASLDDNTINYASSTDWKAKYMEVADMLAETRAELDDFHGSSKELEEELERELERTEKAQQDLKVKVARAEHERDEWKSKFMSLQTTHNMTTTSLQRELDTLRGEHQKIKVQLRELEMGNDDLERNERAISSSLADVESKYGRVLEEKILLEHELMDKANVEEECQRLKDELRDANEEINIMKDQLAAAQSRPPTMTDTESSARSVTSTAPSSISDDNLLSVAAPSDLCLADLSPDSETSARETKETPKYATPRPIRSPTIPGYTPSPLLHRSTYKVSRLATPPTSSSPSMARSSTVPSLSTPSRLPPPYARPETDRQPQCVEFQLYKHQQWCSWDNVKEQGRANGVGDEGSRQGAGTEDPHSRSQVAHGQYNQSNHRDAATSATEGGTFVRVCLACALDIVYAINEQRRKTIAVQTASIEHRFRKGSQACVWR